MVSRHVRWGGVVVGAAILVVGAHYLWRFFAPQSRGPAAESPAPTPETDHTKPTLPQRTFTRQEQDKVRDLNARLVDLQRKLQEMDRKTSLVKLNVTRTNAEVIRLQEAFVRTSAALQSEINKFPGVEKARSELAELEVRKRELTGLLAQAEQHLEYHGKATEAHTTPAPEAGCPYCAKDFEKFVARDAEVVGHVESRIEEMTGELAMVREAARVRAADYGRLQREAQAQSLVQQLRRQQAEEQQAVNAALDGDPDVKAILAERAGLVRERDELIESRRAVYHAAKVVQVEAVPRGSPVGEAPQQR